MTGLRARKRQQVHEAISTAAISLFLERGFDQVSVAEVAAPAEVSKPTLFKYFPTKEDLVLHRISDHQGEAARVVRSREPGEAPLAALHRISCAGLDRRDPSPGSTTTLSARPTTGWSSSTPSLAARMLHYTAVDEEALAEALAEAADELTARARRRLRCSPCSGCWPGGNWLALVEGATAERGSPSAVAAADRAFELLPELG